MQASWWADGFLRRLLDPTDADALNVLRRARLHIVPNMNPDGSRAGYHRCNRHGVNLNAAWNASTPATSPAVRAVLDRMAITGIDFCLDVHADEELPNVFVANMHAFGAPSLTFELPYKMVENSSGRISEYAVPGCIHTGRSSLTAPSHVLDDVAALRTMAGSAIRRP